MSRTGIIWLLILGLVPEFKRTNASRLSPPCALAGAPVVGPKPGRRDVLQALSGYCSGNFRDVFFTANLLCINKLNLSLAHFLFLLIIEWEKYCTSRNLTFQRHIINFLYILMFRLCFSFYLFFLYILPSNNLFDEKNGCQ